MSKFFIRETRSKQNARTGGKYKGNQKLIKGKKRKKENEDLSLNSVKKGGKKASLDVEDIPSDDEESELEHKKKDAASSSEDDEETQQEKRLRLAKKYLEEIEKEEQHRRETEEIDKDIISHRLKQDALEQAGVLQKKLADKLETVTLDDLRVLRGHQLPVTCLVISPDSQYIYTGSKDCSVIKWNIITGKKVKVIPGGRKGTDDRHNGHTSHVLCLAISSDTKFLASGCQNKIIHIWNPDTMELIHTFKGHRDAVSGLTFRKGSHQLFSGSRDRSVKVWNLDEMAYVETLFGHQDGITAIDSLTRERAITSGGRDSTIRIWKIVEESQLVFQGHSASIDCVQLINEQHFVSGTDDGTLSVWGVLKKKPVTSVQLAHGHAPENQLPFWICSVASLQNTDIVASGSHDGEVRIWKCGEDFRNFTLLGTVPIKGFINALQFTKDGKHLVAGVGQEHRLGRWWRIKEARNSIVIIPLSFKT
ncbi:U3 small nuclear riboprotein factor 55K isoform X2 [Tachypleus tridentatus]|uniref:U3 small nuclear riboprotein factor 55K isoform X2 n=1 Tax=Tachypleus tridentatus TaxID=6853 RepID=UPI003FD4265E